MTKNQKPEQPHPSAPQNLQDTTPGAGAGHLRRRAVLGGGLALAGAGPLAALTAPAAQAAPTLASKGASRLQTRSAHSVYTLPGDHQWHSGGIYETGLLQEWHYWSGFVTDVDTHEQFGLFYTDFHNANGPGKFAVTVFFSLMSLDRDDIVWTVQPMTSPLTATAPPGSTSPNDFLYAGQAASTRFQTIYRAGPDTWSLQFHSAAANVPQTIDLSLDLHTQTPYGYLPITPFGMENENQPFTGPPADPTTMYSLSYHYAGPKTDTAGTVTIGNQVRRLKGSLWFEHQWGNFLISQMPWAGTYVYSPLQFYDGSIFTFRQWYNQNGQPLLNLNRYSHSTPDNHTTYGFGEGFEYTPLKTWTSPVTHRNYPVYGRLTTPFGTWYYSPVFPNYEIPLSADPLWEAPALVHTGSLTGPVVGRAFLELPYGLTATFPPIP
jgi:hypothetical protein